MTEKQYLCDFEELQDPGTRGFAGASPAEPGYFVVRKGQQVFAYSNSCPHTGAPLEWQPHQFLDHSGQMLECALHGALFDIETGQCLRGPCIDQELQVRELSVEDGRIYLVD